MLLKQNGTEILPRGILLIHATVTTCTFTHDKVFCFLSCQGKMSF